VPPACHDWVLFEPGHGLAGIAGWAFLEAGVQPRGVAYTAQVEAAAQLAAAGVGPALVPAKTVPTEFRQNTRALDPPVVWEISAFAAHGEWSAQQAKLLEVLRGAGWEQRRPKGAIQVKLERAAQIESGDAREL
jgi:DNA-binding transcriptional LysR family regulator